MAVHLSLLLRLFRVPVPAKWILTTYVFVPLPPNLHLD